MIAHQLEVKEANNEITFTRIFNAPQQLVFDMFKTAEHIKQWWGPTHWPVDHCQLDFREGGEWFYSMKSDETGEEAWAKATYQQIDEPNTIVFKDSFCDANGAVNDALPQGIVTVTFDALSDTTTKLTSRIVYQAAADVETVVKMGMVDGIRDTWQQLANIVEKKEN